jgi:hypothetical protein
MQTTGPPTTRATHPKREEETINYDREHNFSCAEGSTDWAGLGWGGLGLGLGHLNQATDARGLRHGHLAGASRLARATHVRVAALAVDLPDRSMAKGRGCG